MKLQIMATVLCFGLAISVRAQDPPTAPSSYTVQQGDSLWKIAKKCHCSVDELKATNNLQSGIPLAIGQVLVIPASSTGDTVAQTPATSDNQSVSGTQSSTAATCPQAAFLAKGLAAEEAGDLVAAYHWYVRGTGLDLSDVNAITQGKMDTYPEPQKTYQFDCLLSLARAAEKRVMADPSDYRDNNNDDLRHKDIADLALRSAEAIVLNVVGTDGTYHGYTANRLEQIQAQAHDFFHENNQQRADAEAARMADEENTMNAIGQAFQSAATAVQAPAFKPSGSDAEVNGGPQITGMTTTGNQLADRCNNDPGYLKWLNTCNNQLHGANQGPCYCAVAALTQCYINAAPNDPSVKSWEQSRDSALANAKSVGQSCGSP